MKCLYCGKRLGMFKKAADEQYCSPAHRRLHAEEQDRSTLANLAAAQKRYEAVLGLSATDRRTPAEGQNPDAHKPDVYKADVYKAKDNKKKSAVNGSANGGANAGANASANGTNGHHTPPQSETRNLVSIRAFLPLTGPVRAKADLGPGEPVLPLAAVEKPEFERLDRRRKPGLAPTALQRLDVEPGEAAVPLVNPLIECENPASLIPSLPRLHSQRFAAGLPGAGLQSLVTACVSPSSFPDAKSPSPLPGSSPALRLPGVHLAGIGGWAPQGLLGASSAAQAVGERPLLAGRIEPPSPPSGRPPVILAGNPRRLEPPSMFGRKDPIGEIVHQLESPTASFAGKIPVEQSAVSDRVPPRLHPDSGRILVYWQPAPHTPQSKRRGRGDSSGQTPWAFCPELAPLETEAIEGAATVQPVEPELLFEPVERHPVIPALSRNDTHAGLSPVTTGMPLPAPAPTRLACAPAPSTPAEAERPKRVAVAAVSPDYRGDEEVRLADTGFAFAEPGLDVVSRQLRLNGAAVRPEAAKPAQVAGTAVHLVSNPKELEALMAYPSSIALTGVSPRLVLALKRLELADLVPWEARAWKQRDLIALAWEVRPWIPKLRFRIVEDKRTPLGPELGSVAGTAGAGTFLTQLWKTGPSDLKWVVMSVPVILGLMVYSLWPNGKSHTMPGSGGVPAAVQSGQAPNTQVASTSNPEPGDPNHQQEPPSPSPSAAAPLAVAVMPARTETSTFWTNVKQSIMRRAAIELSDDFRAGLGDWDGSTNWSNSWSYDPAGFVRPGALALYRPSVGLTDYKIEFLAQIEKKSLGWVFRAADTNNYYAMKLTIQKPGPLPTVVVERYAVVHGREEAHRVSPLPLQLRTDSIYRVRVDIRGSEFTTQVQGQLADYWSDDRLRSGGVGFFSGRGEQSRVRWVEVQHQYDALGRLCAFLAPYSLPSTRDGSWKQ